MLCLSGLPYALNIRVLKVKTSLSIRNIYFYKLQKAVSLSWIRNINCKNSH